MTSETQNDIGNSNTSTSSTGLGIARIDAVAEWRSKLTQVTGAFLFFEIVSGLVIYVAPFGLFPQVSVLLHTIIGLAMLAPVVWYIVRHWLVRKAGNLSHYQVLGYAATALLVLCAVSGIVLTWQGVTGPGMTPGWDTVHLVTGIAVAVLIAAHLLTVIGRKVNQPEARALLRSARGRFYRGTVVGTLALLAACFIWTFTFATHAPMVAFSSSYNWTFGPDRPFAPSLARLVAADGGMDVRSRVIAAVSESDRPVFVQAIDGDVTEPIGLHGRVRRCMDEIEIDSATRARVESILAESAQHIRDGGAVDPRQLAGSAQCGSSGCHSEIYEEWQSSAHRYSSKDDMFQRVQALMATELSPEHTRYCAGCHDPISLLSGAKNSDNVTLGTLGSDEGSSCLVCHSIVQTDVGGNGDYTIEPARRYAYELDDGPLAKFTSDFLIRTYPDHHIEAYTRPLYKTPEFCGACHKQYIDKEVNTDIGKVVGQNQYDSWKNSRWFHEDSPEKTIECRECHMPLNDSDDPARGDQTDHNRTVDDAKHRSHRWLASNQYMPTLMGLEGAQEHVALTEQWLRGEYEVPEIADRWTTGPVVRLAIIAPEEVQAGDEVPLRVTLTNNKTGHDFPTGPLDMIESWIETTVTNDAGDVVFHTGALDDDGAISETPIVFKVRGFDREGRTIDRHNVWDLVGASYKRAMYPGVTDAVDVQFQCPSMARGRLMQTGDEAAPGQRTDALQFEAPVDDEVQTLHVDVILWYRKANPEFLNRVYGVEANVRTPATQISTAQATITVKPDAKKETQ